MARSVAHRTENGDALSSILGVGVRREYGVAPLSEDTLAHYAQGTVGREEPPTVLSCLILSARTSLQILGRSTEIWYGSDEVHLGLKLVVELSYRVDRCNVEPRSWLHKNQPRMQALLRRGLC